MDTGPALEATKKFQGIDADLGRMITSRGNHVHVLRPGLLSFPIKQYLWSGANIGIITRSGHELVALAAGAITLLPRFGGAENDPPWAEIAQALAFLPDNIIVIQHT
jgi:hypothetical protein